MLECRTPIVPQLKPSPGQGQKDIDLSIVSFSVLKDTFNANCLMHSAKACWREIVRKRRARTSAFHRESVNKSTSHQRPRSQPASARVHTHTYTLTLTHAHSLILFLYPLRHTTRRPLPRAPGTISTIISLHPLVRPATGAQKQVWRKTRYHLQGQNYSRGDYLAGIIQKNTPQLRKPDRPKLFHPS